MPKASTQDNESQRWAEYEFGGSQLNDPRRVRRLVTVAAACAARPTASLPRACGNWAETKAAYRLFGQKELKPEAVLQPHQQRTRERCLQQSLVLVVQDTTGLNYGQRAGLGLVGTGKNGAKGLWLHSSMAFTAQGQALGLVHVDCWARDPKQFGKAAQRHKREQKQKETQRWIDSYEQCVQWAAESRSTHWVNVADREADFYRLFAAAAATPQVGLLVRARHNRRTTEAMDLDQTLKQCPVAGRVKITIPRRPGVAAQEVELEVRFCPIQIQPPARCKGPALNLWVVEARQINAVGKPIVWRLLTNLAVENLEGALEKIRWYQVRWQIEEYHRVIKSGCQTESRQLETAQPLKNLLMVDLVVGWRVLSLSRAGRQEKQQLQEHFTDEEITVINNYRRHTKQPKQMLTLREAVRTVAGMGGFLGRKGDGEPGAMTLWRGLEMLHQLILGWRLAKTCG